MQCITTYLSLIVAEADNKIRHGPQNGHQRLDGVTVHNRPVLLEVLRRKTALVDNSVKHKPNISHKLHFTDELRTPFYAGLYLKQDRGSMFNITRGVLNVCIVDLRRGSCQLIYCGHTSCYSQNWAHI